ncbi:MAG: HAD hydrolase-like protein [Lachnospiraceae bacterium]|nr:HAD hydrolase-like protein [Lachnospiraceae bacterium]
MKKYLLFDLDGTLTDPKVGITTCVQYALKSFGIEEPDLDKLEPFIGPPLAESFQNFYDFSEEQAKEAVKKYRERFQDTGLFENELYVGIPQMLRTLKNNGIHMAVASSKPTVYVERILEHFHIKDFFEVVVGSELDGRRTDKAEVVEEALKQLFGENPVDNKQVYMIGDRKFDIAGAKALHVESIGVTYGYGSMEELKAAKVDYIVSSVKELEKFLLRDTEDKPEQKGTMFQRFWTMLYAFLMYLLVRSAAMYGASWLLSQLVPGIGELAFVTDGEGNMALTGNASTIIAAIGFIAGGIAVYSVAKMLIDKNKEDTRLSHLTPEPVSSYLLMGIVAVGGVIGLNVLLELLQITQKSASYQAVVADQYAAHFVVGILCYGLIAPIAEELLFRGVIYGYMRRFMNLQLAIVFSSALFGFYHMNLVQGVYAFILGCLIAYSYEYFGNFIAPVVMHVIANVLSYCLSYTALSVSGFVSWPVAIVCLVACVVSMRALEKHKRILQ